jgi:hypothetical protein
MTTTAKKGRSSALAANQSPRHRQYENCLADSRARVCIYFAALRFSSTLIDHIYHKFAKFQNLLCYKVQNNWSLRNMLHSPPSGVNCWRQPIQFIYLRLPRGPQWTWFFSEFSVISTYLKGPLSVHQLDKFYDQINYEEISRMLNRFDWACIDDVTLPSDKFALAAFVIQDIK